MAAMTTKLDDDRALREVKAVLLHLQRLGEEPLPAANRAPGSPGGIVASKTHRKFPSTNSLMQFAGLALLAAWASIALANDPHFKYWTTGLLGTPHSVVASGNTSTRFGVVASAVESPADFIGLAGRISKISGELLPPAYSARVSSTDYAIGNAHALMEAGRIMAARRLLSQPAVASTQDGAWKLARSYDPNYLASIASSDASSDKAQAAEWYRRWRDIGVRNGMVMDDARLGRLINSMR